MRKKKGIQEESNEGEHSSRAGSCRVRKCSGWPSMVPSYLQCYSSVPTPFRLKQCFHVPSVHFSRTLLCFDLWTQQACESLKCYPTSPTSELLSALCLLKPLHASLASLNIYMRQQWFWRWLTRWLAFAASVGVFVFVPVLQWLSETGLAKSEPLPRGHRKQLS